MTLEEEIKIQREYGIEEGLERGAAQKQREIAKEMRAEGIDLSTIARITKLSVDEIKFFREVSQSEQKKD